MAFTECPPFSPSQFLQDLKTTADSIGAPYSQSKTQAVLEAYEECFREGVIHLRTTSRPGDRLNYRFYLTRVMRVDTIGIAVEAGFLEADNRMARLAISWSSLFNSSTEQWSDFDAESGLAKTWVNLKGWRPLDDVLNAPGVPEPVRAHGPEFHSLGLDTVGFAAVDYQSDTLNLYFAAFGPVTEAKIARYVNLTQALPPTEEEFADMSKFLDPQGHHFAVTMEYATGTIRRVAFYGVGVPLQELSVVDGRVLKFFSDAPSYGKKDLNIVGWSFGKDNGKYMKCELTYRGDFAFVMREHDRE